MANFRKCEDCGRRTVYLRGVVIYQIGVGKLVVSGQFCPNCGCVREDA